MKLGRMVFALGICVSACLTQWLNPTTNAGARVIQDPPPITGDYTIHSRYLPMRDGVKIAVDVVLPKEPKTDRLPAILIQTRYWRGYDLHLPKHFPNDSRHKENDRDHLVKLLFASQGYAMVFADVRGTGASFGVNPHPWSQDEVKDGGEIVEWIVGQHWSNGKVGALGVSYEGSSAQWLAVPKHPAVRAVVPQYMEFDVYQEIAFPGGLFLEGFIQSWSRTNQLLDRNIPCVQGEPGCAEIMRLIRGVKPVNGSYLQLAHALLQHRRNGDVYKSARTMTFRDDRNAELNAAIDDFSVHTYLKEIEESGVAIFGWGSWMDASTADGVLRRFATLKNPRKAIIGPWSHGGAHHASPYLPPDAPTEPDQFTQFMAVIRFFDFVLKDAANGVDEDPALLYYTMGEEQWKATDVWPPAGTRMQRFYLQANHELTRQAPTGNQGEDHYAVDFEAGTGESNRWWTQLNGQDVVYPDRAAADRRLLTYTSEPLAEDTEITGHPIIKLFIASTHTDGAFYVYLEDVDEAGRVTYLTEGQLRALHRKVSIAPAPYRQFGPYHSFKRADAQPLIAGETAELSFALLPTSALIKQGHRIRVAIAGHDSSIFARVPETGTPLITVARNRRFASFIELPIARRE